MKKNPWRYYPFTCVPKIIYGSWNIRQDRTFCHFGPFSSFSHLTTQKTKILENKKIPGGIIILLMCTINDNHMMYGSWDMDSDRIFYFEPFFALLPPYRPRKSKFWNKKNTYIYYRFTQLHDKWQSYYVWFLRYGAGRT